MLNAGGDSGAGDMDRARFVHGGKRGRPPLPVAEHVGEAGGVYDVSNPAEHGIKAGVVLDPNRDLFHCGQVQWPIPDRCANLDAGRQSLRDYGPANEAGRSCNQKLRIVRPR
jgi:hypothetical protein